ncbi:uncharacterized protein LOC113374931 [Ctenocephalides felis]|uniref:uncharacterized protein LOC113374931 n=1 Tax=Ctenocephalides felis TaxID=7515 RepID=UPI000E6E541D|nr:uncharacterized protein LOC113374931 [Ctenocephalides felis]
MHSILIFLFSTIFCGQVVHGLQHDKGDYRPETYPYDDGKYRPIGDEGKYYHVSDGERGPYYSRYGFGKYTGKYLPDPKGKYKRPVVTTPKYDEGGARIIQQRHGFKNDAYHH